ncbi:MAG TPA: hypothetical protein VMT46_13620 [Anaerolineaceae bacterium]|nr:hypothetical protein [Anaerolineaceae bacterium]
MKINGDERRWLAGYLTFLVVFTSLPYFIGFSNAASEWRFSGFTFGVEDGNSYIAKMLAGQAGDWLFRSPFTAFSQRGVLTFLPYLLLGKLAYPPGLHEQLVALFHLFRISSVCLYSLASYQFLIAFVQDVRFRRLGIVLLTLGGGLGWLLVLAGRTNWLGSLPLDFYSPESFGFLSLFGLPHLAAARALLLWGLLVYLVPETLPQGFRQSWKRGGITGLLWLVMGLFQPLTVVIGWVVLGAHLALGAAWRLFRKQNDPLKRTGWKEHFIAALYAGLVSSPIVAYTMVAYTTDPYLKVWSSQNLILSPHPLHYLVAYGLILPFAILGVKRLIQKNQDWGVFFAGWLILLPFLAYFPFNLQRRLPEGIWTAWVVTAMAWLASQSKPKASRWSYIFTLLLPSSIIFYFGSLFRILTPGAPVYVPVQEAQIFESIQSTVPRDSVFLASFETGNQLPAWAPVHVLIGHGPESANLKEIQPLVENFYHAGESDRTRLELIHRFNVRYVFWGPSEWSLGNWDPSKADYLRLVNRQGDYLYYEVHE